ncbi:MAG: ATP-binding cassette domain-containing protein [Candidatus Kariarchaeaceae archaeon]|jgi:ABC-2 type transport system ATP-binding protein
MAYVIETRDLSKTYSGGVQALKSLNMSIKKGESIGFLGPNGAGKTTTIQILLNLIKATSGKVYLFGQEMLGQERASPRCRSSCGDAWIL